MVLGSPYSAFGQIIDAIDILSRLAAASLKEDNFGNVSKDIPRLIQVFASTIVKLEAFVATMTVDWTDVKFHGRTVDEVDVVLACLREGLRTLVEGFGGYTRELGISEVEIKDAKALAGLVDQEA